MTTDITELAQRMKAAAEKATPGRIGDRIDGSGSIKYQCFGNDGSLVLQTDHKNMEYGFIGPNAEADELLFRECAPENIIALVEALEKAQQQNISDFEIKARLCEESNSLHDRLREAEKRIDELEFHKAALLKFVRDSCYVFDGYDADISDAYIDAASSSLMPKIEAEPCHHCSDGSYSGLPGGACEHCMGTGLDDPAAELESRTVTVKLPEPFKLAKSSSGLTYYYADEVNEALTAQGIKWEAE